MDESSGENEYNDTEVAFLKFMSNLTRTNVEAIKLLEKAQDPSFLEKVCMDSTKRQELVKITERHGVLEKELHSAQDFGASINEFKDRQKLRLVHLKQQIDVISTAAGYCAMIERSCTGAAAVCAKKHPDVIEGSLDDIKVVKSQKEKKRVVKSKAGTTNRADLAANHDASSKFELTTKRRQRRADLAANHDASFKVELTTKRRQRRADLAANHDASSKVELTTKRRQRRPGPRRKRLEKKEPEVLPESVHF